MLLNTLDSTRYYVGSYPCDARQKAVIQLDASINHDHHFRSFGNGAWSPVIKTLSIDCLRVSSGPINSKGSVPQDNFEAF